MGFIDPSRQERDELLPGASGLHLDLEVRRCPACHREVLPWQAECPDCGVTAVRPAELPGSRFVLPGLATDPAPGEGPDGQATTDPAPGEGPDGRATTDPAPGERPDGHAGPDPDAPDRAGGDG